MSCCYYFSTYLAQTTPWLYTHRWLQWMEDVWVESGCESSGGAEEHAATQSELRYPPDRPPLTANRAAVLALRPSSTHRCGPLTFPVSFCLSHCCK